MARIRSIHPGIARSRIMRRASRDDRPLFKPLLTAADDEGLARARIVGDDNVDDLTPKDGTRALNVVLVLSMAKGNYASALRSTDSLGKNLGMWSGGPSSAGAEPVDTGQNDLEDTRAARRLVRETVGK